MSNNDSFIDEVTEEVRRDRLYGAMRRYGWIGILAIALIVAGTAWREWDKRDAEARGRAFGDAVAAALQTQDPAARAAALAAIEADPAQAPLLALLRSGEAVAAGDSAGAAAALRALAEAPGTPDLYRQFARLKLVMAAGTAMDAAERDAILSDLAAAGAPFRPLAMEQQALALVDAGKPDEAITLARRILDEPTVTPALRRRVAQLIVALGGSPLGGDPAAN